MHIHELIKLTSKCFMLLCCLAIVFFVQDVFSEITPEVDAVPVNDPKQDWIVNKVLFLFRDELFDDFS